jgi:hypothetical protein
MKKSALKSFIKFVIKEIMEPERPFFRPVSIEMSRKAMNKMLDKMKKSINDILDAVYRRNEYDATKFHEFLATYEDILLKFSIYWANVSYKHNPKLKDRIDNVMKAFRDNMVEINEQVGKIIISIVSNDYVTTIYGRKHLSDIFERVRELIDELLQISIDSGFGPKRS